MEGDVPAEARDVQSRPSSELGGRKVWLLSPGSGPPKPASSLHSELGGRPIWDVHRCVPGTSRRDLERGTMNGLPPCMAWPCPCVAERRGEAASLLLERIRLSPAWLPSPRLLCGRRRTPSLVLRSVITGNWFISKLPG